MDAPKRPVLSVVKPGHIPDRDDHLSGNRHRRRKDAIDPDVARAAAARVEALLLTGDQSRALNIIMDWWSRPGAPPAMVLTGHAGTGKTTLVQEVVRLIQLEGKRVCLTAPTNKATKVLKEMSARRGLVVDCRTAQSAHGLKLMDDDAEEYLAKGTSLGTASSFDLLVADEASMIDTQLFREFMEATTAGYTRVLFVGDTLQLPPVKSAEAPAFKLEAAVALDKIVRQAEGNQIVMLGDWLRRLILGEKVGAMPATASIDEQGVHLLPSGPFYERMQATIAARQAEGKAGTVRGIAFTNRCVDDMVASARRAIYGDGAAPFVAGERVFALKPYDKMKTDYEAEIVEVAPATGHPHYPDWLTIPLAFEPDEVDPEDDPVRKGWAIHPQHREAWEKHLEDDRRLILNAQRDGQAAWRQGRAAGTMPSALAFQGLEEDGRTHDVRRAWQSHHGFRRAFANLKSVHAITAHRSQGSTFDEVFVNVPDMRGAARVGGDAYKYRLMYVAVTRARGHAWLLW